MKTFFHKLKFKAKEICYQKLLKFSLWLNWPKASAWLLASFSSVNNRGGKYTILVIGRTIFYDDIQAMSEFSGRLNYRPIHLVYWEIIFKHLVEPRERVNLTESNYHSENSNKTGKQKYYHYLRRMFPHLRKFMPFEAVISGNFGYIVQQELARACKDEGIPFLILHKEGIALVSELESDMKLVSNLRFFGAKALFYNETIRQLMIGVKSIGLTPENTVVVGSPRLDVYFRKLGQERKNQIVFFAFHPEQRFAWFDNETDVQSKISLRSEQFYKFIMDFALKHKDIKVIIKTKSAKYYSDYVSGVLKKYFTQDIPNLVITSIGNVKDLISESKVVIGYNSTALLEALLVGRLIIMPYFGDLITKGEWNYFSKYPELINYAKNLADLEEFVFHPDKYLNYDQKRKEEYLTQFFPPPFGQASVKAEEEIIKVIENK